MFKNQKSVSLKSDVSRLAKLGNVQGGLPPLMRGLPVLAILAGEVVAQATDTRNVIEERILGADETILLDPPQDASTQVSGEQIRPGVQMMCLRCLEGQTALGGLQVPVYSRNELIHKQLLARSHESTDSLGILKYLTSKDSGRKLTNLADAF